MTDLRQAAQQALDALESLQGGCTDSDDGTVEALTVWCPEVIDALRTALEQQAEPVAHAVIVGALFDFMGWLTTRKERLVLSSTDNASPAVESITEFAKMRGLSLDDAKVQDWNTSLPQQQAEPVAWDKTSASFNAWWDSYYHDPANPFAEGSAAYWAWAGWQAAKRQWVGLTDEEVQAIWKDVIGWGDLSHDDEDLVRALETKLKERNT